jgi:hypothetical protein
MSLRPTLTKLEKSSLKNKTDQRLWCSGGWEEVLFPYMVKGRETQAEPSTLLS